MALWNHLRRVRSENRRFYSVIFASGIGAGIISLAIGLRQSVWFDEAYSVIIAKKPLGELIHLTQIDIHPPLYYILLKIWASIFGWGELALRSLSVIALVAAIIIAGLLLRRLFNTRIALYATPLIALAPLLLRYGFEIRMYAIGSLIGVLATYLLVRAVQSTKTTRRNWLIAYAVLIAFGLYVQYFLIMLWAAHALWLVLTNWRAKHFFRETHEYIYAFAAGALIFLPWLPVFIHQLSSGVMAPIGKPLNLEQLVGMLSFNTIYQPADQVAMLTTFALVILFITLIFITIKNHKSASQFRSSWLLLVSYIGLPTLVVMLMSLFMTPYTERYLSHVAIGLIMMIASTTAIYATSKKPSSRAKIIVLVVVYGCFIIGTMQLAKVGNFNFQRWEHPTVNQAAGSIKNCGDGAKLIAASPYDAMELNYYMPQCSIYFVSSWTTLTGGYAPLDGKKLQIKTLDDIDASKVVFVHHGDDKSDLPSGYNVISSQQFGNLDVVNLQRK